MRKTIKGDFACLETEVTQRLLATTLGSLLQNFQTSRSFWMFFLLPKETYILQWIGCLEIAWGNFLVMILLTKLFITLWILCHRDTSFQCLSARGNRGDRDQIALFVAPISICSCTQGLNQLFPLLVWVPTIICEYVVLNICPLLDPASPREMSVYVQERVCIRTFIATLFVIAPNWKPRVHQKASGYINGIQIHITDYYVAVTENKVLLHTTRHTRISQTQWRVQEPHTGW